MVTVEEFLKKGSGRVTADGVTFQKVTSLSELPDYLKDKITGLDEGEVIYVSEPLDRKEENYRKLDGVSDWLGQVNPPPEHRYHTTPFTVIGLDDGRMSFVVTEKSLAKDLVKAPDWVSGISETSIPERGRI